MNVMTRDMSELRLAMFIKMLTDKGYPADIAAYLAREIVSGRLKLMEHSQ